MDFRRAGLALAISAAVVTGGGGTAWAALKSGARDAGRSGRVARPMSAQRDEGILTIDNTRRIDINNINMFVTNYGSFAWDLGGQGSPPGLFYPKGTNKTAVFAGGLWLAANVNGAELASAVAEYAQEYGPGPMTVGGGWADPSLPQFKVYKVLRYSGNPQDTAHVEREPNEAAVEDRLVHHSWSEYVNGAGPYGAPLVTLRLPVTTTDDPTDSVDVVGPDVSGDQMLWSIYNDADPSRQGAPAPSSPTPLGVEIQQSTFAFNRQGSLGNIVFMKWIIINKGLNQLDSMFVSIWSDTDLGGAADDLVGVDTTLSLGYTYNATNNDQLYGSAPPAVGYDFFLGPRASNGLILPMTSFNKYINGTDPSTVEDTYIYMNGRVPDGSAEGAPVVDPTTGLETKFFHPGDPVTRSGWLDSNPADRRHLLTSGPFYMSPGDTQVVVCALVIGNGNDRLSSVEAMRFYDTDAQDAFDRGFQLPDPPPQPIVTVNADHGRVTLCWDSASRYNYNEPGYTFEGYNVYQGASIAGPWKRIATFDEVNGILTVRDTVFDINTGRTITDFPVAFGTDAGVRFCYTATEDAVRGGALKDATEYFFAVTAYAFSPTERQAIVENAQIPIRTTPQRPPSGTDPTTAGPLPVVYLQKDTSLPPSTTVVDPIVVKPDQVTGHIYKVTFQALPPESVYTRQVGPDTATVRYTWSLTDSTTGQVLLSNQYNLRGGDEEYRVVDGLQVKVIGAYFPQLQEVTYRNNVATNRRALEGVNWSGNQAWFQGGGGYGVDFFGSTLDPTAMSDSFYTIQLRFDTGATQNGYRYLRKVNASDPAGGAPAGGRAYTYAGFHPVPFQAWDTVNNRQVDIMFLENVMCAPDGTILPPGSQVAPFDSTWMPSADGDGGREYLWLLSTTYSPTEKAAYAVDGLATAGTTPQLYALWSKKRAASDVVDNGDAIDFVWANPATSNDVYVFGTTQLQTHNASLASAALDNIRVVPNPYYNRSRYELNQFARVVRFINMPEEATVRIFTLSGKLIRTLQKTAASSSILEWDLLTDNRLPVASGVYVFHVDAPGVGSTFGRMAVFMEKERLNNF